jgi:hypothetical protein
MDRAEAKHITDFVGQKDPEERKKSPLFQKGKSGWVVEIRGYTYHKEGESFVQDTIIENLKYPGQLEEKKDKEMIERIKQNVSYLFIYDSGKAGPGAGQSKIAKSHLRRLVRGIAEGAVDGKNPGDGRGVRPQGPGIIEGEGKEGANAPANQKANREAWNPIGETAIAVLVNDAGGAFGAPPGKWLPREKIGAPPPPGGDPKAAAQDKAMERIEFVLLFVWREPTASADDKKTAP